MNRKCQVNKHYCFLQDIQNNISRSSLLTLKNTHFELYTRFREKVHGSHLGCDNCIPVSLCVTNESTILFPMQKEDTDEFVILMGG